MASSAASSDAGGQPLRLLMTTDSVGGVWQYSLDLLRELGRVSPIEALLLNLGPKPSCEQQALASTIPGVTLRCGPFALEWMSDPWNDVDASGRWLLEQQAEWHADVVHLNGYAHANLPWDRPTVVVAHSCVLSWFEAVHGTAATPEWTEYARRVQRGLAAATAVLAPSQFMRRALLRYYGCKPETVEVVHNFSSAPAAPAGNKEAFALAVGRMWDRAKNLQLLQQLPQPTAMPIQVAGQITGGVNGLQPLGQLDHEALLERMRSAAVFLHPALYEPFGLAVLEAARQSCCLMLADIPSLRELWEGAAIFLPSGAPELWAAELQRLSQAPQLAYEWGERSRLHAQHYQTGASIAAYIALYQRLVNRVSSISAEKIEAA